MLYLQSSRTSEAELWFKRALKLAPDDSSVRHHYGKRLRHSLIIFSHIPYLLQLYNLFYASLSLLHVILQLNF